MTDKAAGGIRGYRYYMGLHSGISRGPVDELVEIEAGGRKAWPVAEAYGDDAPGSPIATIVLPASYTVQYPPPDQGWGSHYVYFLSAPNTFSKQFKANKTVTLSNFPTFTRNIGPSKQLNRGYKIYYRAPDGSILQILVDNPEDWQYVKDYAPLAFFDPGPWSFVFSGPEPIGERTFTVPVGDCLIQIYLTESEVGDSGYVRYGIIHVTLPESALAAYELLRDDDNTRTVTVSGMNLTAMVDGLPVSYNCNGAYSVLLHPGRRFVYTSADQSEAIRWLGYQKYSKVVEPHVGPWRFEVPLTLSPGAGTDTGYPCTESKQIYINAPNLFGGDSAEGGLVGPMDVMMGEPTQGVNASLKAMLGAESLSAFRGVLTTFYDGLIATLNPYPKEWRFRVRRLLKGWDNDDPFYPEKCQIDLNVEYPDEDGGPAVDHPIASMNGAHILYACLTDRDWGRGLYGMDAIDTASFQTAADQLFEEGFGLCLKWTQQENIDEFMQVVIDHLGGVMYRDRVTSKVSLKLIRNDYSVDDLPVFDRNTGVLSVEEDDSTSSQPLINEIVVKYVDAIKGKEGSVRVQNIARIQSSGGIISDTMSYPGAPTASIASRLALRDLRAKGTPLRRLTLLMDRRAYTLQPGSVFRYVDESRNISNIILRVGKVEDGLNNGSAIKVTCIEDVFGMAANAFTGTIFAPAPVTDTAQVAPYSKIVEASYYDARRSSPGTVAAILSGLGPVFGVAASPNSRHINFDLHSGLDSADLDARLAGLFSPAGKLASDIGMSDTVVLLTGVKDGDQVAIGTPAILNDEIVRVNSWIQETSTLVLGRGCVDTIPQAHPANSTIFFYEGSNYSVDSTLYEEGDTVYGKISTRTGAEVLSVGLATLQSVGIVGRVGRPYPPGNVTIDGTPINSVMGVEPGMTLEWAHRNKVTQADLIVVHGAGSVAPPAGLTYTVQIRDPSDDSLIREATGIAGTSWQYEVDDWIADGYPRRVILKLMSIHDDVECWQQYMVSVNFVGDGWGVSWGYKWGG